jgi:N-acetylglucosamine-6-phosphate deacetylase
MTELAIAAGGIGVVARDGVIVRVDPSAEHPELLLAPGFVDLQCNGGWGIDLAVEPERLWELGTRLPETGVTSWLPTIVSGPDTTVERALDALARRPEGYAGAEPLGLHLEGPMLSVERRGAHPRAALREPATCPVASWTRARGVALVTLAPELPGALDATRMLRDSGVVVSAGHTVADTETMQTAVDAGVTVVTHLFNAMTPFAHREPGPIGVALSDPRLTAGLIADGVHVHPTAVAMAWAALGADRLALVTDAVAVLGQQEGPAYTDGGVLAGSALAMDQAVRNLVAFTGCSAADALAAATMTPARAIGAATKGRIEVGADADLVLLTRDLDVVATYIAGTPVHSVVR